MFRGTSNMFISKILKIILKLWLEISLLIHSINAKLKFALFGIRCEGLKAEGKIYFSAISGDISLGKNVLFGPDVRIGVAKGAKLIIGDNVSINQGTFIIALNSIKIGNDSRIGEYCSIRDNDHEFSDLNIPIRLQGFSAKPVEIGKDVWLGRSVTISKGVTIGSKSVVGASSVVTKNIPSCEVWGGVPAKIIRRR